MKCDHCGETIIGPEVPCWNCGQVTPLPEPERQAGDDSPASPGSEERTTALLRRARNYVDCYISNCNPLEGVTGAEKLLWEIDAAIGAPPNAAISGCEENEHG